MNIYFIADEIAAILQKKKRLLIPVRYPSSLTKEDCIAKATAWLVRIR